jgi:hypothetical protein
MSRWTKDIEYSGDQIIDVNGRPVVVQVLVETTFDEGVCIDDLIDSTAFPEEARELQSSLERGITDVLSISVTVTSKELPSVEGGSSLGGVLVSSRKDFELALNEYQMLHEALQHFKSNIPTTLAYLKAQVAILESFTESKGA